MYLVQFIKFDFCTTLWCLISTCVWGGTSTYFWNIESLYLYAWGYTIPSDLMWSHSELYDLCNPLSRYIREHVNWPPNVTALGHLSIIDLQRIKQRSQSLLDQLEGLRRRSVGISIWLSQNLTNFAFQTNVHPMISLTNNCAEFELKNLIWAPPK